MTKIVFKFIKNIEFNKLGSVVIFTIFYLVLYLSDTNTT